MTRKFIPTPIDGTSSADHLSYEIEEQLPTGGYSSRAAAERGWDRACARANRLRRRQGLTPVTRPACRVSER